MSKTNKSYKKFTDYYHGDPEFRERFLKYIKTKVPCECGVITSRCHMTQHKRTKKHMKRMEEKNKSEKVENVEVKEILKLLKQQQQELLELMKNKK